LNKTAIKNFAVSARKKLIEQVRQKAFQIGVMAKSVTVLKQEAGHLILNNIPQEKGFKLQRDKLIKEIEQKGYDQVMEEVAYTWFNRFIALRFLEVNDYLPTGVRVLSSRDSNRVEPDIIREALNIDLAVDRNVIYDFQDRNDLEGLFKYLLIHQCNDLNKILSFMFETIADYSELLFPSNLLQEGSVIRDLVTSIPEEDWQEVEIIGWLYQYYISEKKDEVFADLKKNTKISKENIPAATQLFTPKWIVQYMVENSLGRLWLESHPNEELKAEWKYYLEEADQEPEVQKQLADLKNPNLNPLEIKALDPCCGSGHILVYAFEVLYEIYKSYGYMEEDIPKLILENNLYGLDIDDRAAQLASFAVMMKARSKSRAVFRENIQLNICAIQESNWMVNDVSEMLVNPEALEPEQYRQRELIRYLADTFKDAKEYGSMIDVREMDPKFLEQRLHEVRNSVVRNLLEVTYRDIIIDKLPGIILQAKIMAEKYDVVCTNPPYMGSRKSMNMKVKKYTEVNFPKGKADLYACFIEKCLEMAGPGRFIAMVTQHSFMFTDDYKDLRKELLTNISYISMLHLGPDAFPEINGEVVQTSAYTMRNMNNSRYFGNYVRLVDINGNKKEQKIYDKDLYYTKCNEDFYDIKGIPISYWISKKMKDTFLTGTTFEEIGVPKQGMATGDNDYFLRNWHEVDYSKIGFNYQSLEEFHGTALLYIPYNKGGKLIKWYGNNDFVIKFNKEHYGMLSNQGNHLPSRQYYFQKCITWSDISGRGFAARYCNYGFAFDVKGSCGFPVEADLGLAISLLNSKLIPKYIDALNPTLTTQVGDLKRIPVLKIAKDIRVIIDELALKSIKIAKASWDSFEKSWDFKIHPFLANKKESATLEGTLENWSIFAENQFNQLKGNEEELNRILINIYGLQAELSPEVEDKDITIRKADRERDIKSFISYAVGCVFGRYSLDEEGLIFAGGKFDPERYKTFKADHDGILPVLSDAYFEDDIVTQFVEFLKVTFGENSLAINLNYIAETLGKKTNETSRECIRRYFLKDFYKDHVQIYKKRPIYWLFTSDKEQGFNALVYMHRYDSSMVSRVRTDYLHPLQNKLEAEYLRLNSVLVSEDSPTEKTKAIKRLKVLTKQMEELKKYDEVIHNLADQQIEIDLDDGVVVNYAKLEKVLAKI